MVRKKFWVYELKFLLSVLNNLKNQVLTMCFIYFFKIQRCIIHQIKSSIKYIPHKTINEKVIIL